MEANVNILITAGGTQEEIDSVRSITNHSTGQLGSIIADTFAKGGATVTYVCGNAAQLPAEKGITIIRIKDTNSLMKQLAKLLETHKYHSIIHAMAVSDFTPTATLNLDDIAQNILQTIESGTHTIQKIKNAITAAAKPLSENKISSCNPDLMLLLAPTPKIISQIKQKQSGTILVGFKLLSGVTEDHLLSVATDLLHRNSCDYVLANDQQGITCNHHKAILIDKAGIISKAETKQEIANLLLNTISERVNQ